MHRNTCFRSAGQTSDTADKFGNADFLYSTDIFGISGHLPFYAVAGYRFLRIVLSFTISHIESIGFTYRHLNVYISEHTLQVFMKFAAHISIRPQ